MNTRDLRLKVFGSNHHFGLFEGGLEAPGLHVSYARPGAPENAITDTFVLLVIVFAI